jgi:hypothetical protein
MGIGPSKTKTVLSFHIYKKNTRAYTHTHTHKGCPKITQVK